MKNVKTLLTAGIIMAAVILAIAGWVLLPDVLVVQVTLSGEAGNTLPKMAGLAIPFFLSIVFAVMYYLHENKKYLFTSCTGLLLFIIIFFTNLLQQIR